MRSTNRLPCGLSVPPLVFRNNTPCRSVRSPSLFVGSTPSTSTNVHSQSSWREQLLAGPCRFAAPALGPALQRHPYRVAHGPHGPLQMLPRPLALAELMPLVKHW